MQTPVEFDEVRTHIWQAPIDYELDALTTVALSDVD